MYYTTKTLQHVQQQYQHVQPYNYHVLQHQIISTKYSSRTIYYIEQCTENYEYFHNCIYTAILNERTRYMYYKQSTNKEQVFFDRLVIDPGHYDTAQQ